MTTRKKLCSIKGISEAKVDKIKVLKLIGAEENGFLLIGRAP